MKSVLPLTKNITLITEDSVLDKRSGKILALSDPKVEREIKNYYFKNSIVATEISDTAEAVISLESKVINFIFKTSDGLVDYKNGFLIEVYDSGSDGKLTKMYLEDIQDPLDENKLINDSFSNYFTLELDVTGSV